jgi:hypothetical protein
MESQAPTLTVREPALHQFAYFLRVAGDDEPALAAARQQAFTTQLEAGVEHLCAILDTEPPPVVLSEPDHVGRHQQIQIYPHPTEGPLFLSDDTHYLWLWAYAIHDSYLIRAIYAATGEYPVAALAQMAAEWLWRPSPHSDLLGHTVYHAAIVAPDQQESYAQMVLGAWASQEQVDLLSVQTPAGPVFAPWVSGEVYAFAYPGAEAETRANRLFDSVIPELAWYWHKVRAQGIHYSQDLYPAMHSAEASVNAAIERVIRQDQVEGDTSHRLARLQAQLHELSDAYVTLSRLTGQAEMMGQTMAINAANYQETVSRLLDADEDAKATAAAWLRLGLRDQAQIEADLVYQRASLERAETVLHTIQSRVDLLRGDIDRRTNLIFALIGIGVAVLEVTGLDNTALLLRLAVVAASLAAVYGLWLLWRRRRRAD